MLQQTVDGFETRDVGSIADPVTEWAAMAHGDDANSGGAGGGQPSGRIFDGDRRLRHEPEPLERQLVGSGPVYLP